MWCEDIVRVSNGVPSDLLTALECDFLRLHLYDRDQRI